MAACKGACLCAAALSRQQRNLTWGGANWPRRPATCQELSPPSQQLERWHWGVAQCIPGPRGTASWTRLPFLSLGPPHSPHLHHLARGVKGCGQRALHPAAAHEDLGHVLSGHSVGHRVGHGHHALPRTVPLRWRQRRGAGQGCRHPVTVSGAVHTVHTVHRNRHAMSSSSSSAMPRHLQGQRTKQAADLMTALPAMPHPTWQPHEPTPTGPPSPGYHHAKPGGGTHPICPRCRWRCWLCRAALSLPTGPRGRRRCLCGRQDVHLPQRAELRGALCHRCGSKPRAHQPQRQPLPRLCRGQPLGAQRPHTRPHDVVGVPLVQPVRHPPAWGQARGWGVAEGEVQVHHDGQCTQRGGVRPVGFTAEVATASAGSCTAAC